jgi:hypothetical protein
MKELVLVCASYRGDSKLAERMISSFNEYNTSGLLLYILVPDEDVAVFGNLQAENVKVVPYGQIPAEFESREVNGIRPGYINQQIAKLCFYRKRLAHNYLAVDSDATFIRPFSVQDFFSNKGLPLQVLHDDKDLQSDQIYFEEYWEGRQKSLDKIWAYLGGEITAPRKTCHGHQMFRSCVLEAMEMQLLKPTQNKDFRDLLEISPYEFSWYNYFLQLHFGDYLAVEPFFRTFHSSNEYLRFNFISGKNIRWQNGYLGVVLNSNFQHQRGKYSPASLSTPPVVFAAEYVTVGKLSAIVLRALGAIACRPWLLLFLAFRFFLRLLAQSWRSFFFSTGKEVGEREK